MSRRYKHRAPGARSIKVLGLLAIVGMLAAIPLASPALTQNAAVTPANEVIGTSSIPVGLDKIEHIIFIVQENRSFDHYFGTYPGAAGIPKKPGGGFATRTCIPDVYLGHCVGPYHTKSDVQIGGAHSHKAAVLDIHGGKMDGFVAGAASGPETRPCIINPQQTWCRKYQGPKGQPDIMSFRNRRDIPNYWALADYGVLQDHLFESVDSYTLPSHMFIFSGWAATCPSGPMSCKGTPTPDPNGNFNWTPIPYLLDMDGVSWSWYVGEDTNVCSAYPKCHQNPGDDVSPPNWNPPPGFNYIQDAPYTLASHIRSVDYFRQALTDCASASCTEVPSVSWVIPAENVSEHPGKGSMQPGYHYVSKLIEDIGSSPVWDSTAVFLYWDDWGGFYDHIKPVKVDGLGYGIRVPGIMISPYAKAGDVDHQVLSSDAMLKLVEDRFLGGKRLDPSEPYMPQDARPTVREDVTPLGDLYNEFDFSQTPRPAPVLPD